MSENYVEKVIEVALKEVGYLEKASDKDLYDKTANAGDKNYTKYGKEMHDIYPSVMDYPAYWCDAFVDWCYYKAYGVANAKSLLGGDFNDYTVASAKLYKDKNAWYTSSPKIGDQIFFKNETRICHTGIVYNVDSTKVYTIEGNTSDADAVVANGGCVAKKSYLLTNSRIAGYGRPKYDVKPSSINTSNSSFNYGIDVSKYQKDIDWNKVKSAGINFAILKIIDGNNNVEETFEKNYSGCIKAGVEIKGVYNYSYATTTSQAIEAAKKVIEVLRGRKLTVWLDIEDELQKNLGSKLIDIINSYRYIIESVGLDFGIYTGESFYNSYIKPYINGLNFKFWIARYGKNTGKIDLAYKPDIKNMVCWQFTSKNQIAGISGYVDTNIWYGNVVVDSNTTKTITSKLVKVITTLNIRSTYNTTGQILGVYNENEIVKILESKEGWYRTNKGWISGKYIKEVYAKVVNCNKLNVRKEPKIDINNVLITIPQNTQVKMIDISDDEKWIKILINNTFGWCSSAYLKNI